MKALPSLASTLLENYPKDPALYGKVAVLKGGWAEHDVSVNSGNEVMKALKSAGVDAHDILIKPDNDWLKKLMTGKFDRVFIALHGRVGEDGTLQGALEILGLPYTGTGVCPSAIAMNKLMAKQVWKASGLPVLPFEALSPDFKPEEIVKKYGLPLAVKPVCEGSSIGISKVKEIEKLRDAYDLAFSHYKTVMVEPWIDATEYTVPILGGYALPSVNIKPTQEFFDYQAKYIDDNTGFFCPSGLSDQEEKEIRQLAENAFNSIGCTALARVDMLRDKDGKFWLMEINTIPGMTTHSTTPRTVGVLGYTFTDFVLTLLAMTL